jgi:lipopolysaccharide biosynthesis regulator YciM
VSQDGIAFVYAFLIAGVVAALGWLAFKRLRRKGQAGEDVYREGLEAMAVGDRAAAIRLLREAVEEDTENIGAYLHLGRLLRMRGDYDRALRIHRELRIRPLKSSERQRVLSEILADLMAAGRWAEAKPVAIELKRAGGQSAFVLRSLGKIYENLKDWENALETFEELEKQRPKPSDRRVALYRAFVARDYHRRGKIKDARRHYEAALKKDPSLPGALLYLGDIQQSENDLAKAIETWKFLIRRNPNTVSLVFDRLEQATFSLDPSRITELAAEYERILAESPSDLSTMRALASLHRRRGDSQEALRVLGDAQEVEADNHGIRLERVKLLLEMGRREEALSEVRDLSRQLGTGRGAEFRCRQCGYRTEEFTWRCPSCSYWETFTE